MKKIKSKVNRNRVLNKKESWLNGVLNKLQDKFPKMVAAIRYLYGLE